MVFDVFRDSIMKSDAVLSTYGVNLYDLIMTAEESVFENTVNSFICIAAIQVCIEIINSSRQLIVVSLIDDVHVFMNLLQNYIFFNS